MSEVKKPVSPAVQELQDIVNALPAMAHKLPGFMDVVKFIGKMVRRQDALEAKLAALTLAGDLVSPGAQ